MIKHLDTGAPVDPKSDIGRVLNIHEPQRIDPESPHFHAFRKAVADEDDKLGREVGSERARLYRGDIEIKFNFSSLRSIEK